MLPRRHHVEQHVHRTIALRIRPPWSERSWFGRSLAGYGIAQLQPSEQPCMSGSPPVIAGRPSRTSYSRSTTPPDGSAGPWWPLFSDEGISGTKGRGRRPGLDALLKGVARREFDIVAAWSVVSAGPIPARPDRSARRATIPQHRPLPAPAGSRYLNAIGQDAVRDVGRIQRVRAGDDPRPGAGRAGSSTVIGQAPGQAEDDAIPGAAHSSGIG